MGYKKLDDKTLESNRKLYEKYEQIINEVVSRRRDKWKLSSINYIDYEDVSQIIKTHIYLKIHLYNEHKSSLKSWLNVVIGHQIINLIRNLYNNYARPCLKCNAAEGDAGCVIYKEQCSNCPLYYNWLKNKKSAHDIKLPLPIVNHEREVHEIMSDNTDIEDITPIFHKLMEERLKPMEYAVYRMIYIEGKKDDEVAKKLNFKAHNQRFKQIFNIKKKIRIEAERIIKDKDIQF